MCLYVISHVLVCNMFYHMCWCVSTFPSHVFVVSMLYHVCLCYITMHLCVIIARFQCKCLWNTCSMLYHMYLHFYHVHVFACVSLFLLHVFVASIMLQLVVFRSRRGKHLANSWLSRALFCLAWLTLVWRWSRHASLL